MSVVVRPRRMAPCSGTAPHPFASRQATPDSPTSSTHRLRGRSQAPVYGDLRAWKRSRGSWTAKSRQTNLTIASTASSSAAIESSRSRRSIFRENCWTRAQCLRRGPAGKDVSSSTGSGMGVDDCVMVHDTVSQTSDRIASSWPCSWQGVRAVGGFLVRPVRVRSEARTGCRSA